jgi:DNA-nicking Smr family endonuclease
MTEDSFDDEFKPDEPVQIPVTDILDLHTVPAREVKPVVENYLEEAHRLGLRALRIIHGRGIGVQREMVRSILSKTPFVAAFCDAPPEAGGWGATVLTLKELEATER